MDLILPLPAVLLAAAHCHYGVDQAEADQQAAADGNPRGEVYEMFANYYFPICERADK